jgi:hypothetical protein
LNVAIKVTKWPGQQGFSGDAKVQFSIYHKFAMSWRKPNQIPTMIAYQNGLAKAFGAEAAGLKDDDEYEMAYWFKVCTVCEIILDLTSLSSASSPSRHYERVQFTACL